MRFGLKNRRANFFRFLTLGSLLFLRSKVGVGSKFQNGRILLILYSMFREFCTDYESEEIIALSQILLELEQI